MPTQQKHTGIMKTASLCCLLALSLPSSLAQTKDSIPPHLEKSALEYMLQRPHVTKHYDNKRIGDHLFTDMGVGLNLSAGGDFKPGAQFTWNVGDFITPEHGIRIGMNGGVFRTGNVKIKYADVTLDYLMNITALSQQKYTTPRPFEVFGVAGFDVVYARNKGESKKGIGAHLGLRGQYAFSPYTYIYAESRAGVMHQNATLSNNWRKMRPTAAVMAGLGYRLLSPDNRAHKYANQTSPKYKHFTQGLFFGIMGGPAFISNAHPSSWNKNVGGRLGLNVGKWFDDYNGLRFSATGTGLLQEQADKVLAFGTQADYLVNLHNVFGGVDITRHWWVNGVAGVSLNYSSSDHKKATSLGLGAGLQGNARLGRPMTFFVEPRVDVYSKDYATVSGTVGRYDCVPSLMLGLIYTNTPTKNLNERPNDEFVFGEWHDHTFIEFGGGLNLNINRTALRHAFNYVRPEVYAGIGRWFAPLHGVRLWGQLGKTRYNEKGSLSRMDFGADYLFNFTNALMGYRHNRLFEFTGGLGASISQHKQLKKVFLGFDASIRGTFNISPFCAVFVEPKLQAYGKNYLPSTFGNSNIDVVASGHAGLQFNMRNYNAKRSNETVEEEGGLRSSFSVAGGLAVPANNARTKRGYNGIGRASYTNWYTPLSAWRTNIQARLGKLSGKYYSTVVAGVDYITDLTAHAYGYNPSRIVSINALAGANIGMDYSNTKSYFTSDIHVGGQFSVRVSNNVNLYLEPQVGYHISKRFDNGSRLDNWQPLVLLGVEHSFTRNSSLANIATPRKKRYVMVDFGTGANSTNLSPQKASYRWTFNVGTGYGQWLTGLHGVEISLTNMTFKRKKHIRENITALRANYMMNLRTAVTGESTDGKLFQLTGLAGASINFNSTKGRSAKVVPGFQGAIQAGWCITPTFEVFIQPEVSFYSSKITPHSSHPIDGQATLSVGSKFHF